MPIYVDVPRYAPSGGVPTNLYADLGEGPAGDMQGAILPDGKDTSVRWDVEAAAAVGVVSWGYTGSAMKPTQGGSSRCLIDTGYMRGRVGARIATLGATPVIGVVARAVDENNYVRFSVATTGVYAFYSIINGASTTMWTSTITAQPGDRIEIGIVDGQTISLYVNGALVQAISAPATLSALQSKRYGMHGTNTTDNVSSLTGFTFNPRY